VTHRLTNDDLSIRDAVGGGARFLLARFYLIIRNGPIYVIDIAAWITDAGRFTRLP